MTARKATTAIGMPKDVAAYLTAPYVHMIIPNAEEGGYLAEVLELPGCISEGDSPEEAYENVRDAMAGWISASLQAGRSIPDPVGDREYSGHFPLRISSELHRACALRAIQEGVSLNQWFTKAIAAQVARENLVDDLAANVAAKVADQLGQVSMTVSAGVRFEVATTGASAREEHLDSVEWRNNAVANMAKQFLLGSPTQPSAASAMAAPGPELKEVSQDA